MLIGSVISTRSWLRTPLVETSLSMKAAAIAPLQTWTQFSVIWRYGGEGLPSFFESGMGDLFTLGPLVTLVFVDGGVCGGTGQKFAREAGLMRAVVL